MVFLSTFINSYCIIWDKLVELAMTKIYNLASPTEKAHATNILLSLYTIIDNKNTMDKKELSCELLQELEKLIDKNNPEYQGLLNSKILFYLKSKKFPIPSPKKVKV